MFDAGAIQSSITRIAPHKAVLINVFPNKEKAEKAKSIAADRKNKLKN